MTLSPDIEKFDVVTIGAGPGGATLATYLTRAGLSVLLLEKQPFPRFHVGESLTGMVAEIIEEFGLTTTMNRHQFPIKGGVKVIGKQAKHEFFVPVMRPTWQVRRDEFDQILLTYAIKQGASYRQGRVKAVLQEGKQVVGVSYVPTDGTDPTAQTVRCQVVVDASGHSTVLSKLGIAGPRIDYAEFNSDVAVFAHYQGVERDPGTMGDNTFIFYSHIHHWAWFIPVAPERVSIGCVIPKSRLEDCGGHRLAMDWALEHINPDLKRRVQDRAPLEPVRVISNYSYEVSPFVGEGWLCIGDAHQFTDPILSFGVSMAMSDARAASQAILQALESGNFHSPFVAYAKRSETGQRTACEIIRYFWKYPSFFGYQMRGKLRKDIIRLLSGDIFQPDQSEAMTLIRQGLARDSAKAPAASVAA